MASKIKHCISYIYVFLVLIGEFLVMANSLEWWLVPTTADHYGHIPE